MAEATNTQQSTAEMSILLYSIAAGELSVRL
jgi:hypothetical protein